MADCGHLARIETVGTGRQAKSRPRATQGHARQRKVERAMGIEPTRAAPLGLEIKQFGAMADLKCDGRVNFRGMWGHVGPRRDTPVCELEPFSRRSPTGHFESFDGRECVPLSGCSRHTVRFHGRTAVIQGGSVRTLSRSTMIIATSANKPYSLPDGCRGFLDRHDYHSNR